MLPESFLRLNSYVHVLIGIDAQRFFVKIVWMGEMNSWV